MTYLMDAVEARHSVRQYTDRKLDQETLDILQKEVARYNQESGLHIQLITEEPEAFNSMLAHYGKFSGVRNYFALVGKKGELLDRKAGYFGERLVLLAQILGLNTCWVVSTYSKRKARIAVGPGEKLVCVIALGYGLSQGRVHQSKDLNALCRADGDIPDWFMRGMKAAMLAPTAMNQQKFHFTLKGKTVSLRAGGGPCTQIDLGIVKYHFEVGAEAGKNVFRWEHVEGI